MKGVDCGRLKDEDRGSSAKQERTLYYSVRHGMDRDISGSRGQIQCPDVAGEVHWKVGLGRGVAGHGASTGHREHPHSVVKGIEGQDVDGIGHVHVSDHCQCTPLPVLAKDKVVRGHHREVVRHIGQLVAGKFVDI